jgi:hypothetical protein
MELKQYKVTFFDKLIGDLIVFASDIEMVRTKVRRQHGEYYINKLKSIEEIQK